MKLEELYIILKDINLPSLPLVVRQLQKVIQSPKTSIKQIALVVAKDQALASKTIRLVNSAYYNVGGKVSSVTDAINYLGLKTVTNMMLGLSVIKVFKESRITSYFNPGLFWMHSFGCAILSKRIASELNHEDPETCFTAGLIHDIGRLILYQYMTKDLFAAMKLSKEMNAPLSLKETEVFGFDHTELGYALAKKWNLPEDLTLCIKYHNSINVMPAHLKKKNNIITIVSKANQLCNKYEIGQSYENYFFPDRHFNNIDIQNEDIEEDLNIVNDEIKSLLKEWGA